MRNDGVLLSRRRSGGGAVYQDLGNSCFSFLMPVAKDELPLDTKEKNNKILIAALQRVGINAVVKGRNDICVNDKKVSGSAYQISLGKSDGTGRKALHHGTMLLKVDTQAVQKYLNPNKEKLKSKGVDSVKARIENLNNVNPNLTHEMLCEAIIHEFKEHFPGYEPRMHSLNIQDMENNPTIKKIYTELTSWEWLFQKTPQFTNNLETRFDWGIIDIFFKVVDSVIVDGKVYSDCLFPEFIDTMNNILVNNKIRYDEDGMTQLCNYIRERHADNNNFISFANDIENWLRRAI